MDRGTLGDVKSMCKGMQGVAANVMQCMLRPRSTAQADMRACVGPPGHLHFVTCWWSLARETPPDGQEPILLRLISRHLVIAIA